MRTEQTACPVLGVLGTPGAPRGRPLGSVPPRRPPLVSASLAQFCAPRELLLPAVPVRPVVPPVRPLHSAAAGHFPALGACVVLSLGQSAGVPSWYLCPACSPLPAPGVVPGQWTPVEGEADLVTPDGVGGGEARGGGVWGQAGACGGPLGTPVGSLQGTMRGCGGHQSRAGRKPLGRGGTHTGSPRAQGQRG